MKSMHTTSIAERRRAFDEARAFFHRFGSVPPLLAALRVEGIEFAEVYRWPRLQPRLHAFEVTRLLASECLINLDGLLAPW